MKLHTYLNFGGNCREAFEFYERHLGGRVTRMATRTELNNPSIPPGWENSIEYASMDLGETQLMGADVPNYQSMRSAYLSLTVDSAAETERIYALLSDAGQIFMKMEETFFAHRFAMLRDKFGTSWMLIHEKPMPGPA